MHFLLSHISIAVCLHTLSLSSALPTQPALSPLATTHPPIHYILRASHIIPDVLSDFNPTHAISLSYNSSSSHPSVHLGNDLPVSAVSSRPTFSFHSLERASSDPEHSNAAIFTLVLTDPDAKSRANPKWSEMCHWIVTNLTAPATTLALPSTQTSKKLLNEIKSYLPPSPPPKTGPHRYVFVLLKHTANTTTPLNPPAARKHWGYGQIRHGVRDWANENALDVVGANFFYAENEKQQSSMQVQFRPPPKQIPSPSSTTALPPPPFHRQPLPPQRQPSA
jgi:phosphatidylethanolamine-binding protein